MKTSFKAGCITGILLGMGAGGCATHTGTGALAGGGLGAATGALIGSATGNAGKGALLGAGLGAVTGGLIGAGQDEVDRKNQARVAAAAAQQACSVQDVATLARSGVGEDTIIAKVRTSPTPYPLSGEEIVYLRNNGVSERTIQVMLHHRPVYVRPQTVIVEPAPVYVVEPRPVVGFGYTYSRW